MLLFPLVLREPEKTKELWFQERLGGFSGPTPGVPPSKVRIPELKVSGWVFLKCIFRFYFKEAAVLKSPSELREEQHPRTGNSKKYIVGVILFHFFNSDRLSNTFFHL